MSEYREIATPSRTKEILLKQDIKFGDIYVFKRKDNNNNNEPNQDLNNE